MGFRACLELFKSLPFTYPDVMDGISPADKVATKASIPTKQNALKDSRSAASLPGYVWLKKKMKIPKIPWFLEPQMPLWEFYPQISQKSWTNFVMWSPTAPTLPAHTPHQPCWGWFLPCWWCPDENARAWNCHPIFPLSSKRCWAQI